MYICHRGSEQLPSDFEFVIYMDLSAAFDTAAVGPKLFKARRFTSCTLHSRIQLVSVSQHTGHFT